MPSFFHTNSEYESVPPVYYTLIKQQTSKSFWAFGEDGAYVRNHSHTGTKIDNFQAPPKVEQIQTSTGHLGRSL